MIIEVEGETKSRSDRGSDRQRMMLLSREGIIHS
jgi:hypothetical protein